MIEHLLCQGVHAHGSIEDSICYYVYSGALTDVLFAAVLCLGVAIFFLVKLR
jgi:hypothetical protein